MRTVRFLINLRVWLPSTGLYFIDGGDAPESFIQRHAVLCRSHSVPKDEKVLAGLGGKHNQEPIVASKYGLVVHLF